MRIYLTCNYCVSRVALHLSLLRLAFQSLSRRYHSFAARPCLSRKSFFQPLVRTFARASCSFLCALFSACLTRGRIVCICIWVQWLYRLQFVDFRGACFLDLAPRKELYCEKTPGQPSKAIWAFKIAQNYTWPKVPSDGAPSSHPDRVLNSN